MFDRDASASVRWAKPTWLRRSAALRRVAVELQQHVGVVGDIRDGLRVVTAVYSPDGTTLPLTVTSTWPVFVL